MLRLPPRRCQDAWTFFGLVRTNFELRYCVEQLNALQMAPFVRNSRVINFQLDPSGFEVPERCTTRYVLTRTVSRSPNCNNHTSASNTNYNHTSTVIRYSSGQLFAIRRRTTHPPIIDPSVKPSLFDLGLYHHRGCRSGSRK